MDRYIFWMLFKIQPGLILVGICCGIIGCTTEATNDNEVDSSTLRKKNAPTQVETVKAVKKPFNYQIHVNGIVEAAKEVEMAFKIGGTLENLAVHEGDKVQKGELLAKFNTLESEYALEKANISLKERELEYKNQLLAMGNQGDSLQMANVRSNIGYITGLKAAELEYKKAVTQFNSTSVRAPFSGVVSNLKVKQGALVKVGDKLCSISSSKSFLVKTEVLETVIGKVNIGQQVNINPLALDKAYTGVVQSINPRVDQYGVVNLTIAVNMPKGLMTGMHVAIIINAPYLENIIIPESALVIRSGKEVVFVEEGGLAKWKYVSTGLKSNNQVEVLEGLVEGDAVITTNNIYLAHDAPITIN